MRDLYILACGVIIGVQLADWLDRYERRIAYRAAELAGDDADRRRRWEAQIREAPPSSDSSATSDAAAATEV